MRVTHHGFVGLLQFFSPEVDQVPVEVYLLDMPHQQVYMLLEERLKPDVVLEQQHLPNKGQKTEC